MQTRQAVLMRSLPVIALALGLALSAAAQPGSGPGLGPRPPPPQGGPQFGGADGPGGPPPFMHPRGPRGTNQLDRAGGPPPINPQQMVALMLERFDADKDGKLNATELAAALAAHPPRRPLRGPHGGTNAPPAGVSANGAPRQGPPPPEMLAAKMIAEFAADKTALTAEELMQALAAHRPMRGGPGGRRGGPLGGPPGGPPQGPPPDAPADQ